MLSIVFYFELECKEIKSLAQFERINYYDKYKLKNYIFTKNAHFWKKNKRYFSTITF